jgi:hypothetical protein
MTEGNYSNVGHRGPVYKGLGAMNPCDNLSIYGSEKRNNQWNRGFKDQTATKIPSANIRWKISLLNFFWIKKEFTSLIIFQRPNYQHGVSLIPAGAIEGYYEGKMPR